MWQSFGDLVHKPLLVDLTVEEGQRLKVIYGSCSGFHAVDVDSGAVYDIYLPTHVCSDFFIFFLSLVNQKGLSEIENLFHSSVLAKMGSNTISFKADLHNRNKLKTLKTITN